MQRQSARREKGWRFVLLFSGALLLADCGSQDVSTEVSPVRPGIDVLLSDSLDLVRGLRVGLITNQTGIGADEVPSIDRLYEHPEVQLVALFSPEHGIRGTVEAGRVVDDQVDARTELPIHSLYGPTRKPTSEMLDGIDALLFDIQDIGARYYTYIYTMALAMEAAGEASIPFLVLDRPNPVGGRQVQGNVLDPAFASFVGRYALPMRHGMTPGELAILFRRAFGIQADLRVVPIEGWSRDMLFPDTGLPWRAPSPNMPGPGKRPSLLRHVSLRGDEPLCGERNGSALPVGGRSMARRRGARPCRFTGCPAGRADRIRPIHTRGTRGWQVRRGGSERRQTPSNRCRDIRSYPDSGHHIDRGASDVG